MDHRPLDTTADALERQRIAHHELGPEGRVRAAIAMSESLRRVTLAGLRESHPEASSEELVLLYIARVHGIRLDSPGCPSKRNPDA